MNKSIYYYVKKLEKTSIYEDMKYKMAKNLSERGFYVEYIEFFAREEGKAIEKYIIETTTEKIRNTKLARKIHKNRLIKKYKKEDKCLRILKLEI